MFLCFLEETDLLEELQTCNELSISRIEKKNFQKHAVSLFLFYSARYSSLSTQNLRVDLTKQLMQKESALCLLGSDKEFTACFIITKPSDTIQMSSHEIRCNIIPHLLFPIAILIYEALPSASLFAIVNPFSPFFFFFSFMPANSPFLKK